MDMYGVIEMMHQNPFLTSHMCRQHLDKPQDQYDMFLDDFNDLFVPFQADNKVEIPLRSNSTSVITRGKSQLEVCILQMESKVSNTNFPVSQTTNSSLVSLASQQTPSPFDSESSLFRQKNARPRESDADLSVSETPLKKQRTASRIEKTDSLGSSPNTENTARVSSPFKAKTVEHVTTAHTQHHTLIESTQSLSVRNPVATTPESHPLQSLKKSDESKTHHSKITSSSSNTPAEKQKEAKLENPSVKKTKSSKPSSKPLEKECNLSKSSSDSEKQKETNTSGSAEKRIQSLKSSSKASGKEKKAANAGKASEKEKKEAKSTKAEKETESSKPTTKAAEKKETKSAKAEKKTESSKPLAKTAEKKETKPAKAEKKTESTKPTTKAAEKKETKSAKAEKETESSKPTTKAAEKKETKPAKTAEKEKKESPQLDPASCTLCSATSSEPDSLSSLASP